MRTLSRTLGLVLLGLLLTAVTATPGVAQQKQVVVHIGQYSNDLHSMAMGLGLANNLQEAGAQVTVFLDREAVRIADRGQPYLVYGDTDTEALMTSFIDGGGAVVVCPHCAMLGGVEASELREGMTLGTMESVARLFLDADLVIDY
jgi:sulfur relay (sulfurtransferase) complex TusBCD TusD component (DsrE family)